MARVHGSQGNLASRMKKLFLSKMGIEDGNMMDGRLASEMIFGGYCGLVGTAREPLIASLEPVFNSKVVVN